MTPSRRFSIASLMGAVLAVSLVLAALRSGSATWAALTFLLACGVLVLALVGVVCSEKTDRAWWLGFTLFGWGYLVLAIIPTYEFLERPTTVLLKALSPYLGKPARSLRPFGRMGFVDEVYFGQIVHCLMCLIAAVIGGLSARLLFGPPSIGTDRTYTDQPPAGRRDWRWRGRLAAVGLASAVAFTTAALIGARNAPGLWTGGTVLLTWGLLGLTAVGAVFHRGPRQARWFGAALFGIGYLLLVSGRSYEQTWPQYATNRLLNVFRPWFPPIATGLSTSSDPVVAANARAQKFLDLTIPMRFPEETPLEVVLNHIKTETREPNGRMIPIYVDPVGLQEAEKTLTSPVRLTLDGVPLRTTLSLLLRQLGMSYKVTGGMILVDYPPDDPEEGQPALEDPFLLIGQCFLAMLAAGLGSLLAPLVAAPGSSQTSAVTIPPA